MPTIITEKWVNSQDLIEQGSPILTSLAQRSRVILHKTEAARDAYARLLRTSNQDEAVQQAARDAACVILAEIRELMTGLAGDLAAADVALPGLALALDQLLLDAPAPLEE